MDQQKEGAHSFHLFHCQSHSLSNLPNSQTGGVSKPSAKNASIQLMVMAQRWQRFAQLAPTIGLGVHLLRCGALLQNPLLVASLRPAWYLPAWEEYVCGERFGFGCFCVSDECLALRSEACLHMPSCGADRSPHLAEQP